MAMIVRMRASAEFQINAHTNKKQTAIKHVPEPSPLYPSNIFTVLAKMATIIGINNGYISVSLVVPRNGNVGEGIVINSI